jgi:stage II sporulation protein M
MSGYRICPVHAVCVNLFKRPDISFKGRKPMFSRALINATLLAAVLFTASGIAGWVYADQLVQFLMPSMEQLERMVEVTQELEPGMRQPILTVMIFLKNLSVTAFLVFFGYIILALPALLVILSNGLLIGVVARVFTEDGFPVQAFIAGLAPHGIFELPAIFLATGFSFVVMTNLFRMRAVPSLGERFRFTIRTIVPLLLVAAMIEVYLTPLAITPFLP